MNKIIFKYDNGKYDPEYMTHEEYLRYIEQPINIESKKAKLELNLLSFVFSDLPDMADFVKETLMSTNAKGIHGELFNIRVIDDDLIISETFPEDIEPEIYIAKDELIKLIDRWIELKDQKADEIVLFKENNQFKFEPVFYKKDKNI